MNTEVTTEYIQSTSQCTTSNDVIFQYLDKLYLESDPIMKQVYFNTIKRLLHGKLEAT